MTKPSSTSSNRVTLAEAAILSIVSKVVPNARLVSVSTRKLFSCIIVVHTDDEKQRVNTDAALLDGMIQAGAMAGRKPDYLTAESQETVDRRWNGDWNYVWR